MILLSACAHPPPYETPQRAGSLPAPVNEASGLAASRRAPGLLWVHNDDGDPLLHAISPSGERRGTLRIAGARNVDWEDLASFELNGRAYLLVADTGDNSGKRTDCVLYIVAEPDPADLSPTRETAAPVEWKIPVRYLDGPRDVESVAVDAREGAVYLLAKRIAPHGLYTLPLRPPADGYTPAAMPLARMPNAFFPQPTASQALMPTATGRYRAQPTAMDLAADGSVAVVLSYGDVLLFPRQKGEPWKTTLMRPPVVLAPHGLAQAEGVCFGADGAIYVVSEGLGSGIIRYPATQP